MRRNSPRDSQTTRHDSPPARPIAEANALTFDSVLVFHSVQIISARRRVQSLANIRTQKLLSSALNAYARNTFVQPEFCILSQKSVTIQSVAILIGQQSVTDGRTDVRTDTDS